MLSNAQSLRVLGIVFLIVAMSQPPDQEWIRQSLYYPYDYSSYSLSVVQRSANLVAYATKKRMKNDVESYLPWKSPNISLWHMFPPAFNCPYRERVGKMSADGSIVCNPGALTPNFVTCIVLSFDTRWIRQFAFEENLAKTTSCAIHYFNPHMTFSEGDNNAPRAVCKRSCGSLQFRNTSLSSRNYTNTSGYEFRTLSAILSNTASSRVDILKIDVEGAEWDIFNDLSTSRTLDIVDQLILTLYFDENRDAVSDVFRVFDVCKAAGLLPFSREIRYAAVAKPGHKPGIVEYSFIRPQSRPLVSFPIVRSKCRCGLAGEMLYMKVEDTYPHNFDEKVPYYPRPFAKYCWRVYRRSQSIINASLESTYFSDTPIVSYNDVKGYGVGNNTTSPYYIWDLFPAAFNCPFQERVGDISQGGSVVCNPGVFANIPCVVFSFSVGYKRGPSFEYDLASSTSCRIYLSDPLLPLLKTRTQQSKHWKSCKFGGCGGEVLMDSYVLGPSNGTHAEGWAMMTLQALLAERRVTRLDILRINIDGGEWDVIREMAHSGALDAVDQLVIQLHYEESRNTMSDLFELFSLCERAGLFPYSNELSYYESAIVGERPHVMEYSFMREDSIAILSKPFVRSKCRCGESSRTRRGTGRVSCRNPSQSKATAVLSRTHANRSDYTPLIVRTKTILQCGWAKDYDHIIFHDGTMSKDDQVYITRHIDFEDIIFADIGNLFSFRGEYPIAMPTPLSEKHDCPAYVDEKKPIGYYVMCSFWFSDVMDTTCGRHYDYMLRIDDDAIVVVSDEDPAMPLHVPFASPGYQGMDYYKVIIGLGRFFRRFANDKIGKAIGSLWPHKEWDSPYTNVMWLNLEWLRRSKVYYIIRREIDNSKCILSSRWGDLPLWGAVAQAVGYSVNTTYLNISYQHYSLQHYVTPGKKIRLADRDELVPIPTTPID